MVESSEQPEGYVAVIRPNRSCSWNQSMLFLASISAVSLLIAIVFFVQGFWLILPFTGLELIILATAFYLVARGGQCCQVISVNGKTLKVAKGWTRNGRLGPE